MKTLLIAFTQRCGSNFLCEQLRVNGIGEPMEYFQYPFEVVNRQLYDELGVDYDDFDKFLNTLVEKRSANGIFAAKLAWDHKNVLINEIKKNPSIDNLEDFFFQNLDGCS